MRLKLWMLSISLVSLAVTAAAQSDRYEWRDKQHVCSIDSSKYVMTDGSKIGTWDEFSGTFFVSLFECRNTKENTDAYENCAKTRVDPQYLKSDFMKEYSMDVDGLTGDLWRVRSGIGFPAPQKDSTMVSSWGNATAHLSSDGMFRYKTIAFAEKSDGEFSEAWFFLEAKCTEVMAPN